jgi:hypothetical protein
VRKVRSIADLKTMVPESWLWRATARGQANTSRDWLNDNRQGSSKCLANDAFHVRYRPKAAVIQSSVIAQQPGGTQPYWTKGQSKSTKASSPCAAVQRTGLSRVSLVRPENYLRRGEPT